MGECGEYYSKHVQLVSEYGGTSLKWRILNYVASLNKTHFFDPNTVHNREVPLYMFVVELNLLSMALLTVRQSSRSA